MYRLRFDLAFYAFRKKFNLLKVWFKITIISFFLSSNNGVGILFILEINASVIHVADFGALRNV